MCSQKGVSPIYGLTPFCVYKEVITLEQKSVEKMGKAPIKKLMLSMGLPVIISMMLQALYNIVDSAFVSNMEGGESA